MPYMANKLYLAIHQFSMDVIPFFCFSFYIFFSQLRVFELLSFWEIVNRRNNIFCPISHQWCDFDVRPSVCVCIFIRVVRRSKSSRGFCYVKCVCGNAIVKMWYVNLCSHRICFVGEAKLALHILRFGHHRPHLIHTHILALSLSVVMPFDFQNLISLLQIPFTYTYTYTYTHIESAQCLRQQQHKHILITLTIMLVYVLLVVKTVIFFSRLAVVATIPFFNSVFNWSRIFFIWELQKNTQNNIHDAFQ